MSKELPYFKFYPSEWISGEITLENVKTQGLFISICAWYWSKNCKINKNFIQRKLVGSNASLKGSLKNLIDSEIIKVDDNDDVTIDFLDEQLAEIQEKHKVLSEAGKKGAEARLKGGLSNKKKIKKKIKIIEDKDKEEGDPVSIAWSDWKKYKKDEFRFNYKSDRSEQAAKTELINLSNNNPETAIKIIEQSIANGWKGLFKLKEDGNKGQNNKGGATREELTAVAFKHFGEKK